MPRTDDTTTILAIDNVEDVHEKRAGDRVATSPGIPCPYAVPYKAASTAVGQAAAGGFFVLAGHVAAGHGHGLDDFIQPHHMPLRDAGAGDQVGGVGLDRTHGIAFNAGDLDISLDRVAGHAQVVFECGFGGIFHDNEGLAMSVCDKGRGHGLSTQEHARSSDKCRHDVFEVEPLGP